MHQHRPLADASLTSNRCTGTGRWLTRTSSSSSAAVQDFIAFLGVTSPQQHQLSIQHHLQNIDDLQAHALHCEAAAAAAMRSGAEDAGATAAGLLRQAKEARAQVGAEQAAVEELSKQNEQVDAAFLPQDMSVPATCADLAARI